MLIKGNTVLIIHRPILYGNLGACSFVSQIFQDEVVDRSELHVVIVKTSRVLTLHFMYIYRDKSKNVLTKEVKPTHISIHLGRAFLTLPLCSFAT